MATKNPLAHIAVVGRRYVGLREVTMNKAPFIAEFWKFTNYKEGMQNKEPWCCAATVAIIQIADKETDDFNLAIPPVTASTAELLKWVQNPKHGCINFTPDDVLKGKFTPRAGDIVHYRPHLSHVGLMGQDYNGDGFIRTLEGNTNADGSREGDGFYEKQRRLTFAGSFTRLPVSQLKK